MSLDPALARALGPLGVAFDPLTFDLVQARAGLDSFAALVGAGVASVPYEDRTIQDVPVRRYLPPGPLRGPEVIWFHGGGWVSGSLGAVDPIVRSLALRIGAPLTSVSYRLAPEHPFPAALDDALVVLRAAPAPVVVGGDSAGGGLAAVLAQVEPERVLAQVLLMPLLDATLSCPSVSRLGSGYGLTRAALRHFVGLYLAGADPEDLRCSPFLASDLGGLPPAVVLSAEFDPLRDEARVYAERLGRAGVPVASWCVPGMVHGFAGMFALTPWADEALDWVVASLRALLSEPGSAASDTP